MQILTNITNVKQWVGGSSGMASADDALLTRLIAAASGQIMTFLSRQTLGKNASTYYGTGNGGNAIVLPQWPVISVSQVLINNVAIPSAGGDPTNAGWLLEPWDGFSAGTPQKIQLNGYAFASALSCGLPYVGGGSPVNDGFTRNSAPFQNPQNVQIDYVTGYFVTDEAATIPATPYQVSTANTLGTWSQDDGVKYSNGTAFTKITTGTPSVGQYKVDTWGTYTFAAADAAQSILISYSYTPSPVEQACIELVGERYSYKDRIGQRTKSQQGVTTASYNLAGMPDAIKAMLQPYRRIMLNR